MNHTIEMFNNMTEDEKEVYMTEFCPSHCGFIDPEIEYDRCYELDIPCEECWKRALEHARNSDKEKEGTMKVEVTRKVEVELEEFWVLRGIKNVTLDYGRRTFDKKEVVVEQVMLTEPTIEDTAEFLVENQAKYGISFCSVEHNYRLKE